jgi:hypothetical protein
LSRSRGVLIVINFVTCGGKKRCVVHLFAIGVIELFCAESVFRDDRGMVVPFNSLASNELVVTMWPDELNWLLTRKFVSFFGRLHDAWNCNYLNLICETDFVHT